MSNNNQNTHKQITKCLKYVWGFDPILVTCIVARSIVSGIVPYIQILISAFVLDSIANGLEAQYLLPRILLGLLIILALQVISGQLTKSRDIRIEYCGHKFDLDAGMKTLTIDYEELEKQRAIQLKTRIANDRNWGVGFFSVYWQLDKLLGKSVDLLASIIILVPAVLKFSGIVPILALVFMFLIVLAASAIRNRSADERISVMMSASMDRIRYFTHFVFSGNVDYKMGKDIRLYNAQDLIFQYVNDDFYQRMIPTTKRFGRLGGLGALISGSASALVQGGAYTLITLQAIATGMTVGSVVVSAAVIYRFSNAISGFTNALMSLSVAAQRQQSTLEYLNFPSVKKEGIGSVPKTVNTLEFSHVSFRYPGSDQYVMEDLSFVLELDGRRSVAIVGVNGSGKTTLVSLVLRLYAPTFGRILIDGIDIQAYEYEEYLKLFSVVFQDYRLFSFSLGENIAASVDVDQERATDALSAYGICDWPLDMMLYKGYDESGVEISVGEAQKIALARALYKDGPLLILDEPTAALDPIAEYEVYSNLHSTIQDKPVIYISHRLSSCRFCDEILVLDQGKIVQRGDHSTLVQEDGGQYYKLWRAQAQYYR